MKLLPKELAANIPKLYQTEDTPIGEKTAIVNFFQPWTSWNWYVIEYDGKDICFGLVHGQETELGYFSLSELQGIQINGFGVRLDEEFEPTQLQHLDAWVYGAAA